MAGRFKIEAIFSAIDKMTAPIARMNKRVEGFISSTEKGLGKVNKFNDSISSGLKRVGAVGAGLAVATGAIVKDIIDTGAAFDQTLVGAAAKFDPELKRGTEGFRRLSEAAQRIGENTEFNAQQGAEALKALAGAGFNAEQAIAALPGVVNLATASEVDLGTASEMATKSLGAFGLKVNDATQLSKNLTRVNDVMAKAAGETDASMSGLFETIKEGAPIAVGTGQSMETFMAMAASLAGAGIEGSVAGTTLKNTMLNLSAPTTKAAKQLKKLGIATKDSDGNMRDALGILGDLEKATKGMGTADRTAVLERIFGRIPLAGVTAMLDQGIDKIAGLRTELEGADGYVDKLAKRMRDTVGGDIDGFTSAIDGVKIAIFDMNTGPIRDVIRSMTAWVKANKGLIVQKVGDAVKWIGDNLPAIVTWAKRIGVAVAVFYAWSTALKGVQLAIESYEAAATVAKATQWLFNKSLAGTEVAGVAAGKGLASMRGALNASALAKSINGVTGTLGKAGMLGAALAVGVAIGSWLNETFELDKKISGWIAELTGLADKLGNRTGKQGLQPGDDQVFSDGSVRRADGSWAFKAPARIAKEAAAFEKLQRGMLGRASEIGTGLYAEPLSAQVREPQMVAPRRVMVESTTSTEKQSVEIRIRDDSGKAEVTQGPKRGAPIRMNLQRSGAF